MRAASQASLTFSYTATGPVIRVSAADLGKTKTFNFGVVAALGLDGRRTRETSTAPRSTGTSRRTPGHGFNGYQVLTKLVLTVTAFTVAPKPAKAGRTFSASMAANQNDTAGPVQSGTVTCSATVAGKRLVAGHARGTERRRRLHLADPGDGEGPRSSAAS